MRDQVSQTSNRRHNPSPQQLKTQFLSDVGGLTVARIVQAFSNPAPKDRNRCAKAVIASVLKSWPPGLKTRYLITAGGFLSFKWPRQVTAADPSDPAPKDVQLIKKAAEKACRDFLTPRIRRRLAKVADYISLGADSVREANDDVKRRTAELVLLFDLHSSQVWITGKSYPGVQERFLVRMNDISEGFVRTSGDRVLLLGCHDLNMFSNRAFRNCNKDGWRAKRIKEMRKMTLHFLPNIVLQHPHRTQSPHAWGTALGGLKKLLYLAKVREFTVAGAGRWYNTKSPLELPCCYSGGQRRYCCCEELQMKASSQMLLGISDLPNRPALYALYGGAGTRVYVAYVGIADSLRRRAAQHLLLRDSSVATGTSAVGINPDYVTALKWWEHHRFSDRKVLEAAEMVAFDVLDPALRSRGGISKVAQALYDSRPFRKEMETLLKKSPSGYLRIPSLEGVARGLAQLEERLQRIEERLKSP